MLAETIDIKTKEVDIAKLMFMALGVNSGLHQDIQKYYEQNDEVYYSYYRKSPHYNDEIFYSLTTKNMDMAKKAAGIMAWECENEPDLPRISKLIKKGYKLTYNFVAQRQFIDIEEYIMKLEPLFKGEAINMPINHLAVFFFMCSYFDKYYVQGDPDVQRFIGILSGRERCFEEEEDAIEKNIRRYKDNITEDTRQYAPRSLKWTI